MPPTQVPTWSVPFTVLIPTLNEERKISGVTRESLLAGADEVIVVDSDSTDATVERATEAGARCVQVSDLAPFGPSLGKGDALWRSLPLVGTEYVVFLDGDLDISGPQFIHSMLTPLLNEGIVFSKAAFDRLNEQAAAIRPGRITETVAKPLLRTHFPQLASMKEPLSGQVAGRVDLFRETAFEIDYGLEIGMLIDLTKRFGFDAIAHPDCGMLSHESQPGGSLDRMTEQVTRAVLSRAGVIAATPTIRGPLTS